MSRILTAAEQSSQLMTKFSQQLADADLRRAKTLPLMAATSLILAGTDKNASTELLATGFRAVRISLRGRFASLEAMTKRSSR
jgi:hypothetical protein